MPKYNRIFTIVIDSLGTGAMPDSEKFGDVGVDTLGHIAEHMKGFHIPNLQKLGIANLRPLKGVAPVEKPTGRFTKFSEASNGKDTVTGHWEMMGIYHDETVQDLHRSVSKELIEELEKRTGHKVIGNKSASGTAILTNSARRRSPQAT